MAASQARFALEQSSENNEWLRAVVQFHVGEELLDVFFNSHSGYRAQFHYGWAHGLSENQVLITDLRARLLQQKDSPLDCRLLSSSLEDIGAVVASPAELARSLEPNLSKVWSCRDIMIGDGTFRQTSLGLTTPRLVFPGEAYWLAISQDDRDAFLEVKGAFVTPSGLYQPKEPQARAKFIQTTGEPGPK